MPPEDPKPEVLTSLPRTRPQRRSAKRDAPKPAARKAQATAKKAPAGKRAPAAKKAPPKPRKTASKPRVHAASQRIPPAGFAPPRDTEERPAPSGVELVGTAIQAAGELAQIGLAVGGQAVRSALSRITKP
jgi:hypothetical protein